MLNGRDAGGTAPGVGDSLGDEVGWDEGAETDPEGAPLGSETVLPGGEGEIAGVSELPGSGVAVGGN
jgi:hypothetical protein